MDMRERRSPTTEAAAPPRPLSKAAGFVPSELDASHWETVAPLYDALLNRPVDSRAALEQWLLDRSELDAACSEARANLYIAMTCRTDDPETGKAYTRYIDEVLPRLRPMSFELDRRLVALADRFPLDPDRYSVLIRNTRADVEIFRQDNVPLQSELDKMAQRYQEISGAMTVQFQGREQTLPQMGRYLEETDRALRESAWRAVAARRLQDRDAIDDLFDRMLDVRARVARNAGFGDYRGYAFASMRRFDYTPQDCQSFHLAVERHIVPIVQRMDERRRRALGVDVLRPWDLAVDEAGRPPLRPFRNGSELLDRSRRLFQALDGSPGGLGEMFADLGENGAPGPCLDLDSRKGKAPGGYQYTRDRSRRSFIFMNAAGLHRDVETMIHEAGHAFHAALARHEPLLAYRDSPIEFSEVASMGMELLSMPAWGEFYSSSADLARARRAQLENRALVILPWIAAVDAFQHWLYTNPGHSREQRNAAWVALMQRFGRAVSWDGLAEERAREWHRQPHLFIHPFYYIEYGIAQLGALGVWLHAREHGQDSALALYKRGLALGGSRPLPELFAAAGLRLDFGEETVARLAGALESELDRADS